VATATSSRPALSQPRSAPKSRLSVRTK
jgi:hypothetical protein